MTFLPSQSKAARALLGWTQATLAKEAGLDITTVSAFERGTKNLNDDSLMRIREVLELRVIFLNSGSPGVRLRPKEAK